MTIFFKRFLKTTSLVFSVYLINVFFIEVIRAETVVDDMRAKGQECAAWVDAGEIRSDRAHICIARCGRYAESVTRNPELFTDDSVRRCDEAYANTKNRLAGVDKATKPVAKAPGTIDEMVKDMNRTKQEWKAKIDNAPGSTENKQAQYCHEACGRGITWISRKGTRINRAQRYWAACKGCGASEFKYTGASKQSKAVKLSMPDIEGTYLQYTRSGIRVRVTGREDWKTYCNEAARIEHDREGFARKVKAGVRVRLTGITYDARYANKAITRCVAEGAIILN